MKAERYFARDFLRALGDLTATLILITFIFGFSKSSMGFEQNQGKELFIQHCSGCHIQGGNIIRRSKTLKLKALKRNGLDDPEAIARVARIGIGSMDGYGDVLGEEGIQLVSNWIWEQAQNAWVQG